jgi:coenzyme PQQ precursor peptide PqqA
MGGMIMRTWKKPQIVEIAVGLEINSYACAD